MPFFRITAVFLLTLISVVGCNGQAKANGDWLKVCPADQFCFSYPAQLQKVPRQIIDSIEGFYSSESLQLSYDFGAYSSNFSELTNPSVQSITVDGRQGEVFTSGNIMALHIPVVRGQVRFSMQLQFIGDIDQELGQKIFDSVKFIPAQQ